MTARKAVLALALALLVAPAAAQADEAIEELRRDTPIAGYGGWSAYSHLVGDRYQLRMIDPQGTTLVIRVPTSSRPFDVSLGPDTNGNVVAVYQRCGTRGCDIRRFSTASSRDELLESVSSPSYREATPAIWRSTVAFTRRVRGCDVPYVKTLGSRAPSRRLLRSRCLTTPAGHLAIRGTRIAVSSLDLSQTDGFGAGRKASEVRRYSARANGPGAAVLLRQTFGEESNLFGQLALDEHHITTVRSGVRQAHGFVRVRTFGGTPQEVPAHAPLTGSFAKTSNGTYLYVEAQDDESDDCTQNVPCRLVRAVFSPFGRQERRLAPRLTVEYVTDRPGRPRQGEPLPFRGRLTRQVVQDGRVIRSEPVAGVGLRLLRRTLEERFAPTAYSGTTGADGSYEIVVPPPIPREPWFTAVASTPVVTWAGRGTTGQSAP